MIQESKIPKVHTKRCVKDYADFSSNSLSFEKETRPFVPKCQKKIHRRRDRGN